MRWARSSVATHVRLSGPCTDLCAKPHTQQPEECLCGRKQPSSARWLQTSGDLLPTCLLRPLQQRRTGSRKNQRRRPARCRPRRPSPRAPVRLRPKEILRSRVQHNSRCRVSLRGLSTSPTAVPRPVRTLRDSKRAGNLPRQVVNAPAVALDAAVYPALRSFHVPHEHAALRCTGVWRFALTSSAAHCIDLSACYNEATASLQHW